MVAIGKEVVVCFLEFGFGGGCRNLEVLTVDFDDYHLLCLPRLTLSDGDNYGDAVIDDQIVLENELAEGCLVRIEQYVCERLAGGIKVIVIGKLQIEGNFQVEIIGRPICVQGAEETTRASSANLMKKKRQPERHQHQLQNSHHEQKKSEKGILENARVAGVAGSSPPSHPDPVTLPIFCSKKLRKVVHEGWMKKSTVTRSAEFELRRKKYLSRVSSIPLQVDEAPLHQGIKFISPYHRRWEIKGRCSFKGVLGHFERRNRESKGMLFSFQLMDNTGSIDITAFDEVAQASFEQIQIDHVYVISNGHLRVAHAKFNRSSSFYEIYLNENSVVREVADDASVIRPNPKFVKIRDLLRTRGNSLVDVMGILEDVSEVTRVTLRSSGQKIQKRTVTILDDSNASVSLTLCGEKLNLLDGAEKKSGNVMMVQRARRGFYEGIRLKVGRDTVLTVNPKMDEADRLQNWYFQQTRRLGRPQFDSSILQLTRLEDPLNKTRLTLAMGKSRMSRASFTLTEGIGLERNNVLSFTMRGMLTAFRQDINMTFPSDPFTRKKFEQVTPEMWYSSSSNKNFSDDDIKWRYALWVRVVDETGGLWMCAFDEAAEVILRYSAREMEKMKKKNKQEWQKVLQDACFKPLIINVIAKRTTFRGNAQLHYIISRVECVKFATEGRRILQEIQNYV